MRFFRGVLWALVFVAPFWASVAFGAKALAVRPVTDAPAFLAKRGLIANPVPIAIVAAGSGDLDNTTYGAPAQGAAYPDRIVIRDDIAREGGLMLAHVALHEYLHQASQWRWDEVPVIHDLAAYMEWGRLYEEGPVEAVALDLLPAYYRFTTGKTIVGRRLGQVYLGWSVDQLAPPAYWPYVQMWRVISARATGRPWRSHDAMEWRVALLTWGPAERMAAVERWT